MKTIETHNSCGRVIIRIEGGSNARCLASAIHMCLPRGELEVTIGDTQVLLQIVRGANTPHVAVSES